jgi:hypothetical protein
MKKLSFLIMNCRMQKINFETLKNDFRIQKSTNQEKEIESFKNENN